MSIRKLRTRLLCIEGLDQRTCFSADCAEAVQVAPAVQTVSTIDQTASSVATCSDKISEIDPTAADCVLAEYGEGESPSFSSPPAGEKFFSPSTGVQNDYNDDGRPDDLPDDIPYQLIPSEGEGEQSPPSTPSLPPNVYVFVPDAPKSVTNTNITTSVTISSSQTLVVCGSGGGTTVNNYSYGFNSPSCCEPDSDSEKEFEKGLDGMDEKQEQPKAKEKEKVAPETPRKHEECPKTPCPQLFHQESCPPPVWECPPVQQFCPPTYWYPTCTDSNESDAGMLPLPMCAAIVGLPFFGLAKDEDKRRGNFHLTA